MEHIKMNDVYRNQLKLDKPSTCTILHSSGGRAIYINSEYPVKLIYANGESIEIFSPYHMTNCGYVFNIHTAWYYKLWNTLIKWFLLLFVVYPTQVRISDLFYKLIDYVNTDDEDIQ